MSIFFVCNNSFIVIRSTPPSHASFVDLYLPHQISLKSKKLFVDGRTYGRTFETGFIRSTRRSRPNKAGLKCLSVRPSVIGARFFIFVRVFVLRDFEFGIK